MMELDVRGDICPYPMMKAIEAMKHLKGDKVIKVIADHSPALETIPPQAQRLEFSVVIEDVAPAEWVITLRREAEEKA